MKHLFKLVIVSVLFCVNGIAQEISTPGEKTTYFFIRHAEKDLSDPSNRNPELTEEGKSRAQNWADILKDTPIDLVFSTDYIRTQETAKPLAVSKNLKIISYNPKDLYSDSFKELTKGKTVLVVGHSNTTPVFVNKVLGKKKYDSIDEKIYGKLFIVTIADNKVTDIMLTIN